jgi:hypothetical protein
MDKSYRSKSLPEQGDGPKLFVDSTISKDRTEGRKQDEEGVLRSSPRRSWALGQSSFDLAGLRTDHSISRAFMSNFRTWISEISQSQPIGDKSVRYEHKANFAKPSASQTSISPIRWRHDLKLRCLANFEPHKDGNQGPKNECSISEGVAFEESSKVEVEPMIDSQHKMIQLKVRQPLFTN